MGLSLKINITTTKWLWLRINEGEKTMLGTEKISQDVESYHGGILSKNDGWGEDLKSKNSQGTECSFTVETSLEE